MSGVFPEPNSLSLSELQERFRGAPTEDPDLWYDELAVTIRQRFPDEGASFLRGEVAWDDPDRLAAILLAITWFDERDSHHADLVIECLEHPDEHVVAIAIEDLAGLGGCGLTERVLALGADPRELVRGAVLRFARQVAPDRAPALLLGALDDPHYIVRENAIDELDELECTPALPRIEALLRDAHPHVRQSALWMIANLAPSSEAIPLLLEALHDPEATVRCAAVEHLGESKEFNDLDVFERMLEDPDEDVRWHARDALDRRMPDSAGSADPP